MNPGEILHDLDEVLDLGVRLHAGAVVDLQAVHHFGHALSVQVQEGLNEIAVDETLKMARNFEKFCANTTKNALPPWVQSCARYGNSSSSRVRSSPPT